MVETGKIGKRDIVLEIGPGRGALTEKLLETGAKVMAVEKDDELFELLKQKFEREILSRQFVLVHKDILNFQTSNLQTYKLIANIPYNITGAILKKFLGADRQPERMVLLVQKEVAERIVGNRGRQASMKESVLSISVKAYGTPKYVETVKAGSFAPMPGVDSAIIAIDDISKEFFKTSAVSANPRYAEGSGEARGYDVLKEKEFFVMVRAGFKSKRKKLSSNLASIPGVDKSMVAKAFQKLNLDDNLRAEDGVSRLGGNLFVLF